VIDLSLQDLQQMIEDQTAPIAVIGLGYVGLPVACEFARVGFQVIGIEQRKERVIQINQGLSPIAGEEPELAELLALVIATGRLSVSTDYQELHNCQVILIAVETPIDEFNRPEYLALRRALLGMGALLQPGTLVIVESTLSPGSMQKMVAPLLVETSGLTLSRDFFLGYCPERVMPGKLLSNLRSVSRVVGGMTTETAQVMATLYRHIVLADLDLTDCITAELVKTVENAYRDVQIAFANEAALICEAVGGDVWKVRQLVNKSPFRQMHLPGAGVGGHCIPKDPWLLVDGVSRVTSGIHADEKLADSRLEEEFSPTLIPSARRINDNMPMHVASLLAQSLAEAGLSLKGAQILILGFAYLEDSDDTRNSPSASLVEILRDHGAKVIIHDPYIQQFQGEVLARAAGCDAAVIMVSHSPYLALDPQDLRSVLHWPILVDGRHVFDGPALRKAGWIYRAVGQSLESMQA